jgi:hypothetical protein
MSYQKALDDIISFAKIHELEINGLGAELAIPDLNNLIIGENRQVVAVSDEIIEAEMDLKGTLSQTKSYSGEASLVFGAFAGFTSSEEQNIDLINKETYPRTTVGFLMKRFFTEDKYYYVPVNSIESTYDVSESLESNPIAVEISNVLEQSNIDLFELAKLVESLKTDQIDLAIVKAFIQSSILPIKICEYVNARRINATENGNINFEPTIQHVDSTYRLSVIIDGESYTPTLSFEHDDVLNKVCTNIVLKTSEFTGYGKSPVGC